MAFASPDKNIAQFVLSPGMRVADFGAGAGYYSIAALDAVGDTGEVYVIDIQPELLTNAKSLDPYNRSNLHFIRGDIEAENGSTLTTGIADAVIISNVLFQVENPEAVATEAYRVLASNGRVMAIDWSDSFGGIGPAPEHVYPKAEAITAFESAGFSVQREFDAGEHHWGIIFTKRHG